jgi:hypothetical protein
LYFFAKCFAAALLVKLGDVGIFVRCSVSKPYAIVPGEVAGGFGCGKYVISWNNLIKKLKVNSLNLIFLCVNLLLKRLIEDAISASKVGLFY